VTLNNVVAATGQEVVFTTREQYLEVIRSLKADGFNMCVDVTVVDYLTAQDARMLPEGSVIERFEVVVNLLSFAQHRRIRVRVQVPESDPSIESLYDLYPGSDAMEREAYDMFGIRFLNHPDLTRILMPEDWEGHPLRKDFAQGRIPVQFKFPEGKYTAEDRP
jgi:NADH-quinone oxidoreductase subunit C